MPSKGRALCPPRGVFGYVTLGSLLGALQGTACPLLNRVGSSSVVPEGTLALMRFRRAGAHSLDYAPDRHSPLTSVDERLSRDPSWDH